MKKDVGVSIARVPRPFHLRRRWLVLGAVILLAGGAAVGVLIARPWAVAVTSEPPTIWEEITSGIVDGKVPKQVAVEAFSYLFRVPIPGVTVPAGRDDSDAPTSGSGALSWVQGDWAELTPDQQAVITRFITPGPNDTIVHFDASAEAAPTLIPVAKAGQSMGILAADNPIVDAIEADLSADLKHLGPKLGISTISKGLPGTSLIPALNDVTIDVSDLSGGNVLMETNSEYYLGLYSPCNVTVYRNAWSGAPLSGGKVSDKLHVLLTHEAVHCYQNVIWGNNATQHAIPSWIKEGTAEWLAGNDTGIVEPSLPSDWRDGYFAHPEMDLIDRSYDAVGYFALLDHLGRNLWSLMAPAWRAAAAASSNPSDASHAFIAVLDGDASDVRDAWAPSLVRRDDWSDPWVAYGFGLAADDQVKLHPIDATSTRATYELNSRSNAVDQVQSSSGEIVTVNTTGLLSAHDDSGDMVLSSQSERFCTVAACVCKPGTARAGEDLAQQHMRLPFILAFNAPEGGSSYLVTALKLDDECGKAPPSPPGSGSGSGGSAGLGSGASPCSGGCAGDNGDPHLMTIDQHRYDFQAAGEFTLLRSPDGSLEIQGRQEAWQGSDHLAINTAIAARVGTHRIGIYVDGDLVQVRVDGTLTKVGQPLDLGSGGRIVPYSLGYEVDFPDGTTLWAMSTGQWGINAQIRPSLALRGDGTGILGLVPPAGMMVPELPDGSGLPVPADAHAGFLELNQTFANAWRVTAASSLFDYAPDTSTASFTNEDFPSEATSVTLADLPAASLASAQQACAAITDPALHDQCLFDVATTGQAGFSNLYQVTQAFDAGGSTALDSPAPSASAAPIVAPSPAAGVTELLPDIQGLAGQALGPDGTLYLSVQLPDNSYIVVAADPQLGRIDKQVPANGGGQVAVVGGSVWVSEKAAGACTIVRLDPTDLATQATIPIPCFFGTPTFASLGQSIWFVDPTSMDINLGGAVLRQLDASTNQPTAVSAPITYGGGTLHPGIGSIFYDYSQDTLFMAAGETAFESLGHIDLPVAGTGRGVWSETSDVTSAVLTGPSGVVATVPIGGQLVGADDQAVYTAGGPGSGSTDSLWRYPADGSAPAQVVATGAQVPTAVNAADLGYFDDSPLLIGQHAAVKLWLPTSRTNRLNDALDLKWIALP
jgi:hypothetical protein